MGKTIQGTFIFLANRAKNKEALNDTEMNEENLKALGMEFEGKLK